jgi:predicted transcriptional regulator
LAVYRTQLKIVGDILTTTRDNVKDDGASVTYLIRTANVSHGRLSKILNNLVSQGLLEQVNSDGALRYKISMSGREFLTAYQTFHKFTNDFGLTI